MFSIDKKLAQMRQKVMCIKGQHDWKGCKCSCCGTTRDEEHDWNGCVCTICGKKRDEGHIWNGCICTVCGKIRSEGHVWACCYCEVCGKARTVEDGLSYYSEKPACAGCDCKAGTPEELFAAFGATNEVGEVEMEGKICPLTTVRCSVCKRIVISSNITTCSRNYRR